MALGIDAAAHLGGLGGAGSSIAVLGTGIDIVYPDGNRKLAERLEHEGCLVCDFEPGTTPSRWNFPVRNRLISGLSRGVLVIEAALKSGSLITARCALDQGRDVFAMPGSIHSPLSKGAHALLREGAKLTECADDVLFALGLREQPPAPAPARREPRDIVLDAMGFAPISLEQLAACSGISIPEIAQKLSRLELEGRVAVLAGGLFQRTTRAAAPH
jgi:DNA processing protein